MRDPTYDWVIHTMMFSDGFEMGDFRFVAGCW